MHDSSFVDSHRFTCSYITYAVGVEDQLFDDLDTLEADEDGRLSPPLTRFSNQPRELLIQLFDKHSDVRSSDRPRVVSASATERARLIRTLTHDKSRKIGEMVNGIFEANRDDDYLASACLLCMANRGYGDFLVNELDKISFDRVDVNYLHLEYLRSISTSRDDVVQSKLIEIMNATANESYFTVALSAVTETDDETVFRLATKILDSLPADSGTRAGEQILTLIGERFPVKAKAVYEKYLSNGSAARAEAICRVLWYEIPLTVEVLPPLLDDKRLLDGFSSPTRVCDRAAQAISHVAKEIEFRSDWGFEQKDLAIEKLKKFCEEYSK